MYIIVIFFLFFIGVIKIEYKNEDFVKYNIILINRISKNILILIFNLEFENYYFLKIM